MKIYDCSLLNDEIDLLELRLMEIGDIVDEFVVVEAAHDWQQRDKPSVLIEKGSNLPCRDKITHVLVDDYTPGPHPEIEWPQRRGIFRGVDGADFKDIIFFGDADEIPSRGAIEMARKTPPDRPYVLVQHLFYHRINLLQRSPWNGTIVMPRGLGELDFQGIRDCRNILPAIPDGGWHFSWLGSMNQLKHKLSCHTIAEDAARYGSKVDVPDINDEAFLAECMATGKDMFGRDDEAYAEKQFIQLFPGTYHPTTIEVWLERHPQYFTNPLEIETRC